MYNKVEYLKINTIEQLQAVFAEWLQMDGVDIEVHCGHYCIDGHSILGLMSLDYASNCLEVIYRKASDFTLDELDHMAVVACM